MARSRTSLCDALTAALPAGSKEQISKNTPIWPAFKGKVRYIYTRSRSCEPLYSPSPGCDPEQTQLSSHFLTTSVAVVQTAKTSIFMTDLLNKQQEGVLGIGIEVLIYSTKHTTTLFVSKVDTTGYVVNHPPSRIKIICTTFIKWLVGIERQKHPNRKVVVSLFARAQSQYLFPGSAENGLKRPLDDRQLIKWWAKVLDPLLDTSASGQPRSASSSTDVCGYLTIPGYSKHELMSYLPRNEHQHARSWKPGHPLLELSKTRGLPPDAPPRSMLPRFPDDPKSRFMQDLDDEVGLTESYSVTVSPAKRKSGRWNNVRDLDRFWEAMEFRQECSSGRVVGFLWVVIDSAEASSNGELIAENGGSQESANSCADSDRAATPTPSAKSSPSKRKRKRLTGPVISRQPRLKNGSSSLTASSADLDTMIDSQRGDGLLISREGYDKAMQTLLHLDFANVEAAARSTTKWVAEVASSCGLTGDWGVDIIGTAENVGAGDRSREERSAASNEPAEVNDLGGMVRKKKRKAGESAVTEHQDESKADAQNAVNSLNGAAVRKKPKAAAT
ncbi:hypothetical protein BAUCODRAFT_225688 [Baudoinia panamericana UAMH 10762]|uniref:histone acetyltransferase n=1 Tax=Baudoinia panamericana (strain UAMH 10762) TaxID=717646 RepID=M2MCH7_BAUPA|nr:uncharacterized protein BAUCODRAFT_225688 [Baudoinia panamericana UAMH 10762]EMC94226.1 hypothetical protein BAUCODRAFT_225688 [Baudoinia panamericana UAMH 10762]